MAAIASYPAPGTSVQLETKSFVEGLNLNGLLLMEPVNQFFSVKKFLDDEGHREILKRHDFIHANSNFAVNGCEYNYTFNDEGLQLKLTDGSAVLEVERDFSLQELDCSNEKIIAINELFLRVMVAEKKLLFNEFIDYFQDPILGPFLRSSLQINNDRINVGPSKEFEVINKEGSLEVMVLGEYVLAKTKSGIVFQSSHDWLKGEQSGLYLSDDLKDKSNKCSTAELRMLLNSLKKIKEAEKTPFQKRMSEQLVVTDENDKTYIL